MTDTLHVLGQLTPAAITLTTAYTVPAATTALISTMMVCNTTAVAATFRVSVAIAGAADTLAQYIYRDVTINGNDTFAASLGLTLATTDLIRVYASTTGITFNLFGDEVS